MSLREVLLIAMLGAGATRGLLAQEPATHDSLAPMTLEPLVASGTRDQRSILVQPVATSVADTAAIRQGRTVGLDEPLRMMPGVQAATRYGLADVRLGIRGSAANTLLGVRGVGVLLDGIPITEPDGAGRLDLIELAAVRSIEVVRGPESARYAGSPAGVVNFRSRTGRDSRGAVIRAQGGSFGTAKLDGYLGDMFADDRGSLFLGGSYTQADGYRDHNDGQLARAFLNADYRLAPRTRLSVEASGSNLDTRLPLSLTQAEADTMPEAAAPNAIRFDVGRGDRRYRAGVRLEHELGAAGGTASAYAFYGGRTLQFVAPGLRVDLNFHRVQAGGRVRAVRVGNAAVDIVAGADYDNVFGADRRWLNAPSAPETLLDDGYDAAPNLGLYAQAEWHPSPSVTVTGGARWEHVHFRFESYLPSATVPRKDTTFSQLSPRGIVTWTAAPGRSLYVSVARGFQVPIFAELSGSPGEPFSPVGPKSLWNYEAGTHLLLGSRVLADIAAYYSDVQGEFVPAFGEDGLPETASASKSRNIGLELALTAAATDWLQLSGSYTLSDFRLQEFSNEVQGPDGVRDTVDFSGKRLPGIPVHRATAEARLRPTGTFEASVQLEWQGELFVETGNQAAGTWYSPGAPSGEPFRAAPARALVHIAGRWQLGAVTLFGSAENLLGTRYIASVLPNDFFGRFYETGAGTVLTLGVAFAGWPRGGVNHGTIDEQ